MRFIIASQPGANSKQPSPDDPFDEELFVRYMKFNEELQKAGVLVASEGLNPGGKGARVEVKNGKRAITDGPFAESKELVGGFYIVDVKSLDEAVSWALRCPTGFSFADVLEIRALTGEEDIPPALLELTRKVAPEWMASLDKRGSK